ncbi:flagellar hook-associated protein FlgK [Camelliibacillus cellulosilyticus]|uniref:Flagellar hook-associated protein 1 n=1 Tax=Camelliibacillus cellulosilyticus TaxID=2174486 RepID=A0ABV9GJS0_9BACL
MISAFGSLEAVRRALFAQQGAIQTTGHNIANANTAGYSRQRVTFNPSLPYPSVGFNRPQISGQIGTGVDIGSIDRIRDSFLDNQVRGEASSVGYWSAKSDALSKLENLMNEPSDHGLSKVLDDFWQSLQDLASNPENSGTRSVVRQRGQTVADTFHYLSSQLNKQQDDLKMQMGVSVDKVNALVQQINEINKQIAKTEPNGYAANDLYDQRDALVDELSQYVDIRVSTVSSGGLSPGNAVGKYTIQMVAKDPSTGQEKTYTLVDGNNLKAHKLQIDFSGDSPSLSVDGNAIPAGYSTGGSIQGSIESYSNVPNMLSALDQMAYNLVKAFNKVHEGGYGHAADGQTPPTGNLFFNDLDDVKGAAANIDLSDAIKSSIDNIAASSDPNGSGDNTIAQNLADVLSKQNMTFQVANGADTETATTTLKGFLQSIIGQLGVNAEAANRNMANSQTLMANADQRRMSVSGVSLDEEMTSLIQYQHAYNAAARMVTVIDQMLDTIVNQMGRS